MGAVGDFAVSHVVFDVKLPDVVAHCILTLTRHSSQPLCSPFIKQVFVAVIMLFVRPTAMLARVMCSWYAFCKVLDQHFSPTLSDWDTSLNRYCTSDFKKGRFGRISTHLFQKPKPSNQKHCLSLFDCC